MRVGRRACAGLTVCLSGPGGVRIRNHEFSSAGKTCGSFVLFLFFSEGRCWADESSYAANMQDAPSGLGVMQLMQPELHNYLDYSATSAKQSRARFNCEPHEHLLFSTQCPHTVSALSTPTAMVGLLRFAYHSNQKS